MRDVVATCARDATRTCLQLVKRAYGVASCVCAIEIDFTLLCGHNLRHFLALCLGSGTEHIAFFKTYIRTNRHISQ